MSVCPTLCDDDCDILCHQEHRVPAKRTHDAATCARRGEQVAALRRDGSIVYYDGPLLPRAIDEAHPAWLVKEVYDEWLDGRVKSLRDAAKSDDPDVLWDVAYNTYGPGEFILISTLVKLAARSS